MIQPLTPIITFNRIFFKESSRWESIRLFLLSNLRIQTLGVYLFVFAISLSSMSMEADKEKKNKAKKDDGECTKTKNKGIYVLFCCLL